MTLIGTIAISPWLIGSVPARFQLWLACGVTLSFTLWITSNIINKNHDKRVILPLPVVLLGLLVSVGIIQLTIPYAPTPVTTAWAAALDLNLTGIDEIQNRQVTSVAPALTRFQVARLITIVLAGFLGAQLFRSPLHFLWLFGTMAAVGAALAVFGIAQKLTWNGQLFGTIPLRYGGEPFATFVNRNNAAGFLNICLAAGLGGILLASGRSLQQKRDSIVIIFLALVTLTAAGIVASTSRGGMTSAVAGFLIVAPWFINVFGKRALVGISIGGLTVLSLGIWLHFGATAVQRLETLNDLPNALQGRWKHWCDTVVALQDRAWLGSGWGTYRYANLPYQQHEVNTWYWNADNQFIEIAVEGGVVTVFIVTAILMAFATLLLLLRSSKSNLAKALKTCGAFLLVSLSLQSMTDFGISLMAPALASSVLMGAISAMASRHLMKCSTGMFFHHWPGSRIVTSIAMALLLGGTSWAGCEMVRAQPGITFCEQVPVKLDAPDLLTPNELMNLVEQGRKISQKLPENAEVHLNLARLLIYRYRQATLDSNAAGPSAMSRKIAWQQSRLESLSHSLHLLPDPEWSNHVRQSPTISNNLPEAIAELNAAYTACQIMPGVSYRIALLSALDLNQIGKKSSAKKLLRREALLSSGNPARLLNLGNAALEDDDDELAVLCWRRAVTQQPGLLKEVVEAARIGLEDDQISLRILSTPEQLIAFSEITSDRAARQAIAGRLNSFRSDLQLAHSSAKDGQVEWISANMSLLADRQDEAMENLRRAVALEPFQITWRVKLADLMIQVGNDASAREHLAFASRMAPENREIKKRLQAVVTRVLRKRAADGGASHSPKMHLHRNSSTMSQGPPALFVVTNSKASREGRL